MNSTPLLPPLKSEKQYFFSICRQQSVKEVAFPEKKEKKA
jgi:hypothetical protein